MNNNYDETDDINQIKNELNQIKNDYEMLRNDIYQIKQIFGSQCIDLKCKDCNKYLYFEDVEMCRFCEKCEIFCYECINKKKCFICNKTKICCLNHIKCYSCEKIYELCIFHTDLLKCNYCNKYQCNNCNKYQYSNRHCSNCSNSV